MTRQLTKDNHAALLLSDHAGKSLLSLNYYPLDGSVVFHTRFEYNMTYAAFRMYAVVSANDVIVRCILNVRVAVKSITHMFI